VRFTKVLRRQDGSWKITGGNERHAALRHGDQLCSETWRRPSRGGSARSTPRSRVVREPLGPSCPRRRVVRRATSWRPRLEPGLEMGARIIAMPISDMMVRIALGKPV